MRSERGTTLVEVLVATTLAVAVIGVLLGTFDSVTKATASHERTLDARADLRQAAAEIARDLRAATSISPPVDPGDWRREITFDVPGVDGGGATVRLSARPADETVVREVLAGASAGTRRTVLGAARFEADPQVFRYFDADGGELDPDTVEGDRIAACTTRVEVTLAAGRDGGAVQRLTVGAALRSRRPEEVPC